MLTRLTLRRHRPTFALRFLSDKAGDADAKDDTGSSETKKPKSKPLEEKSAASVKIQELLKSMVEANKMKQEEDKHPIIAAPGFYKRKQKPDVVEVKEEKIEEKVTAAVSEVAKALGGDTKKTEAELLSRVLGDVTQTPTKLSDLVSGMKIDRSRDPDDSFQRESRLQQVRRFAERGSTVSSRPPTRRPQREGGMQKPGLAKPMVIQLYNEKPLGILKRTETPNYGPRLETWEKLSQRELTLAMTQPPRNYFEKMAMWTEEGKIWKFPIDNEQGMDEEAKVHFSEHVFVDSHLEGWCPEKGPIRHFMELVCVGLSKNPLYTAQEKKDHIMWFKDYFESKKSIIDGLEVAEAEKPVEKNA